MYHVGDFEIVSGKAFITDPCYERGTWCQALVEGVKNGKWEAHIDIRDEGRPGLLQVHHEGVNPKSLRWFKVEADIGVDSGQAGVFDAQHYRTDASIPADLKSLRPGGLKRYGTEDGELFYAACCDRTLGPTGEGMRSNDFHGGGTIPFGAVSSSGYGDGGYEAQVGKNDEGEIVAIEIEFIPEEENCPECGYPEDQCVCDEDEDEDEGPDAIDEIFHAKKD